MDLAEEFTFLVPGHKWHPKFKQKIWDGKMRLLNARTREIYYGLMPEIEKRCEKHGYSVENRVKTGSRDFSAFEAARFVSDLGLPENKQPRDYQMESLIHGIRNDRALFLSPTASGKSLMIYLMQEWYRARTLVIVPNTNLVEQMYSDFVEYGCDNKRIHRVRSGSGSEAKAGFIGDDHIVVTTWQSAMNLDPDWFNRFDVLIGDEVHLFKANELKKIVEACRSVYVRFGFTGTLDGTQTHELVLSGLFGPVRKVITTKELIEKKSVSDLTIKVVALKYSEDVRTLMKKATWKDEMSFLEDYMPRNVFLKNLALSLKGNSIVLFEKKSHGKHLHQMMLDSDPSRTVLYIDGDVHALERNAILRRMELERDIILVASYGTLSTGANVVNLDNVVFARPMKSRIRNLQSLGRGLRRGEDKDHCTLIDPIDDLGIDGWINTTFKHGMGRLNTYRKEGFVVKRYDVKLGVNG